MPSLLLRYPPTPELPRGPRLWTLLAATTAAGELAGLQEIWRALEPEEQPPGIEAILQTQLFAGFPRTINALGKVHQLGVRAEALQVEPVPVAEWRSRGEALCAAIYGAGYPRLREKMGQLHPAMDAWMIELGYGRVLSRGGLSAPHRELCAVTVLAGQGESVAPQLESHLRGSLRLGVAPAAVEAVLQPTAELFGSAAHAVAHHVWARVRKGASH